MTSASPRIPIAAFARHGLLALLAWIGACASTPSGPAVDLRPDELAAATQALVAAPPAEWPARMQAVLPWGTAAAGPLAQALRQRPEAAGAPAALALLGHLGGAEAAACASEFLTAAPEVAVEAALALGAMRSEPARVALWALANDRLADPALRAACTAALLRLGERAQLRPLVRAFVLADTPSGLEVQARVGLANKNRWAFERHLVAQALREVGGEPLWFDTDASWPDLAAAADRIDGWLAAAR